jgi:hypothetical protein
MAFLHDSSPPFRLAAMVASFACAAVLTSAPVVLGLDLPAEHHAWGRFQPGSWVRTRLTTFETAADGNDKVAGVTVTTTRLEAVRADGITLVVESSTDGGPAKVETLEQGWDGLPLAAERASRLSIGEIKIEGKSFACQTHETTAEVDGAPTTVKWWYCPDRSPYLLKSLLRTEGATPRFFSTEVTALAVEREVLDRKLLCFESRWTETTNDRATRTTAYGSLEVPGGLVGYESQTRDKRRGHVERARLELEAFEAAP